MQPSISSKHTENTMSTFHSHMPTKAVKLQSAVSYMHKFCLIPLSYLYALSVMYGSSFLPFSHFYLTLSTPHCSEKKSFPSHAALDVCEKMGSLERGSSLVLFALVCYFCLFVLDIIIKSESAVGKRLDAYMCRVFNTCS